MILRLFYALILALVAPCLHAVELPGIPQFMDEMVAKHGFERGELEQIFGRAQHRQAIIDTISKPATLKPWPEYRATFVNDKRVAGGLQFWALHADALRRAEQQYGVPQEIIVALIGVETLYGSNSGKHSVLDALVTLAFDYPRRAEFFRGELEQYLLLAREQKLDLFKVQGSYAGAMGIPQFMPGSYRRYAVDFGGDGTADLLHDPQDAIGSVANYLKQYGWSSGEPVTMPARTEEGADSSALAPGARAVAEWAAGGVRLESTVAADKAARLLTFTVTGGKELWLAFANFDVITRYNNSDFYAMTVYQLAEALRAARETGTQE
ncbi:MAG: membrane-bound lytic murein transglycosylase B [Gallionellaceae bacterium]|nr:MAG: membrane-bound lytic murein transglycosylase B [Gallionellaceae bacterium]